MVFAVVMGDELVGVVEGVGDVFGLRGKLSAERGESHAVRVSADQRCPTSFSRRASCWDTAGGVRPVCSAARVMLPWLAMACSRSSRPGSSGMKLNFTPPQGG